MNKQYLPPAPAMDGAHTRLSELAATYRSG
jgi:hypothetical protein